MLISKVLFFFNFTNIFTKWYYYLQAMFKTDYQSRFPIITIHYLIKAQEVRYHLFKFVSISGALNLNHVLFVRPNCPLYKLCQIKKLCSYSGTRPHCFSLISSLGYSKVSYSIYCTDVTTVSKQHRSYFYLIYILLKCSIDILKLEKGTNILT